MYSYTEFDDAFIAERNAQFRAQVERRIDGSLTEDEFKPLRLQPPDAQAGRYCCQMG